MSRRLEKYIEARKRTLCAFYKKTGQDRYYYAHKELNFLLKELKKEPKHYENMPKM